MYTRHMFCNRFLYFSSELAALLPSERQWEGFKVPSRSLYQSTWHGHPTHEVCSFLSFYRFKTLQFQRVYFWVFSSLTPHPRIGLRPAGYYSIGEEKPEEARFNDLKTLIASHCKQPIRIGKVDIILTNPIPNIPNLWKWKDYWCYKVDDGSAE